MKKQSKSSIWLQQRDHEILAFCIEQKFASLQNIYFKFFDKRQSPKEAIKNGLFTARQRLSKLVKSGYLTQIHINEIKGSIFMATRLGFDAFINSFENTIGFLPRFFLDRPSLIHDNLVASIRISLERKKRSSFWLPEVRIKDREFAIDYFKKRLPENALPDGIICTPEGNRVALEFENSVKSKERLIDKFRIYEQIMREENPIFSKVLWVYSNSNIERVLTKLNLEQSSKHFFDSLSRLQLQLLAPEIITYKGEQNEKNNLG